MVNFIVDDLFGLIRVLREEGVTIAGEPMEEEDGKVGWIIDPEGNKIDLWEPPKGRKKICSKASHSYLCTPNKNPPLPKATADKEGSLAQLVQSICLTSRGSAVRTRQLPQQNRLFQYH